MNRREGFTLIEVLISIALMGLILPALYKTVDLLQDSNTQIYNYLNTEKKETISMQTFFLDIASSDGNLTLVNGEYDRLCMEKTKNSLYGLSEVKVCWIVLKHKHTLVRAEGTIFHLPIKDDERVEVDAIMQSVTLFDVNWAEDKVLVVLQQKRQKPIVFMVRGITKPKIHKKKALKKKKRVKKPSGDSRILPE
ncbi:MAG: prepilin-type N-terminal cleavage/methylation domain-containing protein [Sulfurovum sp.]|nr:prepilin-type N-terminal cleavage/methylation domain-containing protein [Sulfurovum sp.]